MGPGALIGRDQELVELAARLDSARLVTVVGPGGVGKTALARVAGSALSDRFPLGVMRVDLTRIDDPEALPGAIAAQLGFDSFDALLGSPADQPVLLVFDNCEHLLDAAADTIVRLLSVCRQPSVIATSRAPLEVPGESILSLAPLPMPTGGDPLECPSVQLFLTRCHEAGVASDEIDLDALADLCRQLDGLPLAIELAAARARTMSVAEIGARLAESGDVLTRRQFRGDPRHRSLTDTVEWSYDLLSPEAAVLFERLGVFAGPFRADTARAVAAALVPDPSAGFDAAFDELVNASLIAVDTGARHTRYRLYDTVRAFARNRLERRGEMEAVYDRFVDHVADRVRAQLAGATVRWRADLMRDLINSFDDIAEALRWCIAHDPAPTRAHRISSALWGVVHQAHAEDIVDLMRRLTERFPDTSTRGGVQATVVRATAEYIVGRPRVALELAEPLAARTEPDLQRVMTHRILGQARSAVGDRDGAVSAFLDGAALGSSLGMLAMAHELAVAAAVVQADTGDLDVGLRSVADVVARAEADGSELSRSWARTVQAWLLARVDATAAFETATIALDEAGRAGYPIAIAVNHRTQAYAHLLRGDTTAATVVLTGLLDDLIRRRAVSNARVLVDPVAALARTVGHPAADTLAATTRALPITTLPCSQFELVPLGEAAVPALARHEVIAFVRGVLDELAMSATPAGGPRAAAIQVGAAAQLPASGSAAGAPLPRGYVRRDGDLCEFEFGGRRVTVRRTKGIVDIVRLLAVGGAEVSAVELVDAGVEQASTGELVDARARREYQDRIRELQAEIDAAEHDNDYTRAYRYQVELDAIIEHLTAALGRAGRGRRGADTAERARSAVTHRVRSAIRQLDTSHPALARHLRHAIRTGTYCSYQPEHPVDWNVDEG